MRRNLTAADDVLHSILTDILEAALTSECGIAIPTSEVDRLRAHLYRLRSADPRFSVLTFSISPTSEEELWITKGASLSFNPARRPSEEE